MASTYSVVADQETLGYIHVREGNTLVAALWAPDIVAVNQSEEDPAATQIEMRSGSWYKTGASVRETFGAVELALRILRIRKKSDGKEQAA